MSKSRVLTPKGSVNSFTSTSPPKLLLTTSRVCSATLVFPYQYGQLIVEAGLNGERWIVRGQCLETPHESLLGTLEVKVERKGAVLFGKKSMPYRQLKLKLIKTPEDDNGWVHLVELGVGERLRWKRYQKRRLEVRKSCQGMVWAE